MVGNTPAPLTSIILPAYVPTPELRDVTIKCLRTLAKTTERKSYQLVIVDNGSYSEASDMLCRYGSKDDTYVCLDEPVGYARAANIGLALAKHDWLLVLNTDIEFIEAGWLEQLQADYLDLPGGVLSAMDEDRKPKIFFDWSWFSCWITQRRVIQEVGYFDESLPFRFHDQDYAIRVKRAGYEVMRDGKVKVKHIDSATYDTMGRDEDSAEEAELIRRWGGRSFQEWLERGQSAPA